MGFGYGNDIMDVAFGLVFWGFYWHGIHDERCFDDSSRAWSKIQRLSNVLWWDWRIGIIVMVVSDRD